MRHFMDVTKSAISLYSIRRNEMPGLMTIGVGLENIRGTRMGFRGLDQYPSTSAVDNTYRFVQQVECHQLIADPYDVTKRALDDILYAFNFHPIGRDEAFFRKLFHMPKPE